MAFEEPLRRTSNQTTSLMEDAGELELLRQLPCRHVLHVCCFFYDRHTSSLTICQFTSYSMPVLNSICSTRAVVRCVASPFVTNDLGGQVSVGTPEILHCNSNYRDAIVVPRTICQPITILSSSTSSWCPGNYVITTLYVSMTKPMTCQ